MNCVRCNTPLEANARFCRNCGLPAETSIKQIQQTQQEAIRLPAPPNDVTQAQPQSWDPPTQPAYSIQSPQQWQSSQQTQPTYTRAANAQADTPGTFRPMPAQPAKPKRRRGVGGCLLTSFGVIVVLIIGLGLVWSFVVRPYLHNLALHQLDQAMTQAVNQVPQLPQAPSAPVPVPGGAQPTRTVAVTDTELNNAITLNIAPSDPVQHVNMHVTPNNIVLTFQVSGLPSTVTGVPQVQGNKLVFTNVTISGVAGLVLSPDDISSLVNSHLSDALKRLNSQAQQVVLKDSEMDITILMGQSNTSALPSYVFDAKDWR